jgi:hypothetical protein
MSAIDYFVPGSLTWPSPRGIGAYLPAMPEGVASAYVAALTQPGDLVLDPFCQAGRVLRESAALGRRALGSNFNPIAARWIESQLWPHDPLQVVAAFVRLGDMPRGDMTLRQHVTSLYATRCPTCGKDAVAEWFSWDRDEGRPTQKHVRCAACKTDSTGPTDEADAVTALKFERRGMAYHFALERAAPDEPDERERAAAVVEAYTARAIAVLSDFLRKYDAASQAEQFALRPLLLTGFEAGLALHSADEERPRPRSLKIPPKFYERNIWLAMEDALPAQSARAAPLQPALVRSNDVASLLVSREPAALLVSRGAKELGQLVEPGRARLILAVPPQPDPTLWALSAVWAGWLWGHSARATDSLRPLLARRRADVDWWWHGLAQALYALLPTLSAEGHVVFVTPDADEDALAGLMLAGASAGLALDHALVEPRMGLRVMWRALQRAQSIPSRTVEVDTLAGEIGEKASRTASEILCARGEPTRWPFIHAAIQSELARLDLLRAAVRLPEGGPQPVEFIKKATLDALRAPRSPVYPVEDVRGLWWLTDPGKAGMPLSDRIEAAVYHLLAQTPQASSESDLMAVIYYDFPNLLTPERAYVRLCLQSYAIEDQPGVWKLREEDQLHARQEEIASLRAELIALGERLDCRVEEHQGRVTWTKSAHGTSYPAFTFALSATAELGTHLLAPRPPHGKPVLVLPGGRGALAHHKLRHDVRLRDAVAGAGWAFVKFRQLRNLIAQPSLDMAFFHDALGQDPLIEKEGQQMALL